MLVNILVYLIINLIKAINDSPPFFLGEVQGFFNLIGKKGIVFNIFP